MVAETLYVLQQSIACDVEELRLCHCADLSNPVQRYCLVFLNMKALVCLCSYNHVHECLMYVVVFYHRRRRQLLLFPVQRVFAS